MQEILIQVGVRLLIFIILAPIGYKMFMSFSEDFNVDMRPEAPKNLREPTDQERRYFIRNYFLLGMDPDSDRSKKYVEELAGKLLVTDSHLINMDDPYNGCILVDLVCDDGEVCKGNEICGDYEENKKLINGAEILIYCAVDESKSMKIITTAAKAYITKEH